MKNNFHFSPLNIITSELKNLKEKEAKVIERRFGIVKEPTTLAQIGRDLNLSRERVRQIEKEACRKLSKNIADKYDDVIQNILAHFSKNGGIVAKKDVAEKILSAKINKSEGEVEALHLFIALLPQIEEIEKHNRINDSWILTDINKEDMAKILNLWAEHLAKTKKPQKIDLLIKSLPNPERYQVSFLLSLPKVSRDIIKTYNGDLALNSWSEFNPRTIRDKIFYVLKKNQKPMHFVEIAKVIKTENFDTKKVVVATVHNELISDKRYVLIGRGIYALSEWGYKKGTVREIIVDVLKKAEGALTLADIYQQVSKQRMVRKNTILINLQTQKEFKKAGSDKYILA